MKMANFYLREVGYSQQQELHLPLAVHWSHRTRSSRAFPLRALTTEKTSDSGRFRDESPSYSYCLSFLPFYERLKQA